MHANSKQMWPTRQHANAQARECMCSAHRCALDSSAAAALHDHPRTESTTLASKRTGVPSQSLLHAPTMASSPSIFSKASLRAWLTSRSCANQDGEMECTHPTARLHRPATSQTAASGKRPSATRPSSPQ
eukprot:15414713-Alexandrium_andersonii.AAC.1